MSGTPTKLGSASDMTLVNKDAVDAWSRQLGDLAGSAKGSYANNSGNAGNILGKILANGSNYDNLIKMMSSGPNGLSAQLKSISDAQNSYDPQAGLNAFISRSPELQGLAGQMADGAFDQSNTSARALAKNTSAQAMNATADQLAAAGLLGSGAGVGALTEAALNPTLQMETSLANQRAGLYGNTYGNLANQTLAGFNTGYANLSDLAMRGALGSSQAANQNFGLMGSMYGQQDQSLAAAAQGYAGLAGNDANLYANILGQQGNLNQPIYWQPQYSAGKNYGANALAGAGSGAALGSALGAAGGPLAFLTVPGGAALGGLLGGIIGGFS